MLTIVYSKNSMEPWGCCTAEKKPERYTKCGSHDDQSWHSSCKRMLCTWLQIRILFNYLWEDWIEMVIGNLNWATKVRVWKGYFCNWLRKNWPTLTSSSHWTTSKYWLPPYLLPLLEFQKNLPPINISHLKSWSPPLSPTLQRDRRGRGTMLNQRTKNQLILSIDPCDTADFRGPKP